MPDRCCTTTQAQTYIQPKAAGMAAAVCCWSVDNAVHTIRRLCCDLHLLAAGVCHCRCWVVHQGVCAILQGWYMLFCPGNTPQTSTRPLAT
jgi:hypothetical protein